MSKGRPSLFGTRLKANGRSEELDAWYHAEAKRRTVLNGKRVTVAELVRIAMEAYRIQCELADFGPRIKTAMQETSQEVETTAEPYSEASDNNGEVEL